VTCAFIYDAVYNSTLAVEKAGMTVASPPGRVDNWDKQKPTSAQIAVQKPIEPAM
jgi:hypothetical protein